MLSRHKKVRSNVFSRVRASLLVLLIFASVVTTLPILQSTSASALSTSKDNPTIYSDQIKSYLFYAGVKFCLENSGLKDGLTGDGYIKPENASAGRWFASGKLSTTDMNLGVYMKDSVDGMKADGNVYCSNTSLIMNAISFWRNAGAQGMDTKSVLLGSGFEIDGNSNYIRPKGKSYSASQFKEYIKKNVYDNNDIPEPTGAQLYVYYLHALDQSCIPDIDKNGIPPSKTAPDKSDTVVDILKNVKWVNTKDIPSTPAKVETGYYGSSISNSSESNYILLGTQSKHLTCPQLTQGMSDHANEYMAAINTWAENNKSAAEAEAAIQRNKTGKSNTTNVSGSSCAVTGIGWILCPVINFMAGVVDASYSIVSKLLTTPSLSTDTDQNAKDNGIYKAWSIMRNFANIAFVIAFLIIIFSQITSVGITNYGIKKMLPRLVIAAILVNLSYFICVIAVDLSNIIGSSLKQVFDGVGAQIDVVPRLLGSSAGDGWQGMATVALGLSVTSWLGGLSLLLPALIAAMVAIVVVFLVLTIRQALIIILIVISPIAFVAFLLPNTEELFKKWQSLLTTLLLMFPIIATIFGASALASKVIMSDANASFAVQLMGALVAIVPLALTPIIMKSAGGTLGSIGAKIQGLSKAPSDALNKRAADVRKRELTRMDNRDMNSTAFNPRRRFLQRRARIEATDQNQQRELTRGTNAYLAKATSDNTVGLAQQTLSKATGGILGGQGLRDQMVAGGTAGAADRARANAASVISKQTAEEIAAASILTENLDTAGQLALAKGKVAGGFDASNNQALRSSGMARVLNSGDNNAINDLHNHVVNGGDKDEMIAYANAVSAASSRPSYISGGNIEDIRQGNNPGTSDQLAANAITSGAITTEKLTKAGKDELDYVLNIAKDPNIVTDNTILKKNASEATTNPIYTGQIGKQRSTLEDIIKLP